MARRKFDLKALKDTPPWEWPEDTGSRLLEILRDDRAPETERLLAADLAGDHTVTDDEVAGVLMAITRDGKQSDDLRATAALSLGPVLEHSDLMGFDDPDDVTISERIFQQIQDTLRELFSNTDLSMELRRRLLEASARAPQGWHEDAIRTAYASGVDAWTLTAVFCMRYVRGFDAPILEALSHQNPAIRCEAILAAGEWGLDAAWPQVSALLASSKTEKPLLIAAIDAAANIRPKEAPQLLEHLADSDDEDIADAVAEALDMVEEGEDMFGEDDEDDEDGEDDEDDEDGEPDDRKLLN